MSARPASTPHVVIGLAGAHRGGTVAVVCDGRPVAVCDHERVTRSRSAGLVAHGMPLETLQLALGSSELAGTAPAEFVVAEADLRAIDGGWPLVDHHLAHAVSAGLGAFDGALVFVCDRAVPSPVSLWRTAGDRLIRMDDGWQGAGFADVYADIARAMGFTRRDEYKLEGLARVGRPRWPDRAADLVGLGDEGLRIAPDLVSQVIAWIGDAPAHHSHQFVADIAATLQAHLASLLIEFLRRHATGGTLCLGGGLFHNTAFTTTVAEAGLFESVRVPIDPGNAGVAVGAALLRAGHARAPMPSPFLGPRADRGEVKATLDNCKVSYDYVQEHGAVERAVDMVRQGQLVGWFTGRMEWGRRALGHRSILAAPGSPYILENLNRFLKHRAPHVAYGLTVCEEDAPRFFERARPSPFMQFEFALKDPDLFRGAIPAGASRVRVQTVGEEPSPFRQLLKMTAEAGLPPVLINTSFNGYREPIVCTPRDAVRAFYGTGLDALLMEGFLLSK